MADVTPDPILRLATGFMAAKHMFVANEIGVFRHLALGPATLDELSERTNVPRRTVRILADAMVAVGLLERHENQYQNGAVAAAYLSGHDGHGLGPLLRFWNHISYVAWLKLEDAVRSGQAQTHHGHFSEEEQRIFSQGVEAITAGQAQALATTYNFGRHSRILDVGGGTGNFLAAALRRHTGLQGTLFELPTVVPVAQQRLAREPNADRIQIVGGDFFQDSLPRDHDVVIVANVVHLFSPQRNQELCRRIRAATSVGSRLLLVDFWTDATHTQPVAAALLAGEFLVIAGEGDVYSVEEAQEWLPGCGWRFLEHAPLSGPASLIVAEAV